MRSSSKQELVERILSVVRRLSWEDLLTPGRFA
jgi:hypothetical protein